MRWDHQARKDPQAYKALRYAMASEGRELLVLTEIYVNYIQNFGAGIISGARKFDHISPVLRELC